MRRHTLIALAAVSFSMSASAQIGIHMPKDNSRQQWSNKKPKDTTRAADRMPVAKPDTITKEKCRW